MRVYELLLSQDVEVPMSSEEKWFLQYIWELSTKVFDSLAESVIRSPAAVGCGGLNEAIEDVCKESWASFGCGAFDPWGYWILSANKYLHMDYHADTIDVGALKDDKSSLVIAVIRETLTRCVKENYCERREALINP